MNAIIYKISCLTNLHVGNGEANFSVIDNAVEKDPVTGLPTINSSGVKGALRQYFKENGADDELLTKIFGSEQKTSQGNGSIPGQVKFYQADLLARPVRASRGGEAYYMATSCDAIEMYNRKVEIFGGTPISTEDISGGNYTNLDSIGIEGDIKLAKADIPVKLKGLVAAGLVVLKNAMLKNISLPVLARNQLEDGISKNLWYEEVVPHKSIFTFAVSSENEDVLKKFAENLGNKAFVQFGGNASIGYGLCKVEPLKEA